MVIRYPTTYYSNWKEVKFVDKNLQKGTKDPHQRDESKISPWIFLVKIPETEEIWGNWDQHPAQHTKAENFTRMIPENHIQNTLSVLILLGQITPGFKKDKILKCTFIWKIEEYNGRKSFRQAWSKCGCNPDDTEEDSHWGEGFTYRNPDNLILFTTDMKP